MELVKFPLGISNPLKEKTNLLQSTRVPANVEQDWLIKANYYLMLSRFIYMKVTYVFVRANSFL